MRQKLILEQNHIDHLLQLLNPLELQGVLDRLIFNIANKSEYRYLLDVLKNTVDKRESKIVLRTANQHYVLQIKDIIHLEADGAYTRFYTTTQKIMVSKNIKHYQNILDDRFIRCHQSHLINRKHVLGIEKEGILRLTNNELVPFSTRNRAKIIKMLDGFNNLRKVS